MEIQKEKLGKVSITVEKDYWNPNKIYDRLVIVEREGTGTTYLSRKVVPVGTMLDNRKYWIKFSKWADIPYEITQEFGDNEEVVISQKVITEKLSELQNKINSLHPGIIGISITSDIDTIYSGDDTNVTITVKTINNMKADNIKIKINNDVIAYEENVSQLVISTILNSTTIVDAFAEQNGFNYNISKEIKGVKPYYIGSGTEYNDVINNSNKQPIKSSPDGTYNITINNDEDYLWFIIPNDMIINEVTMSGFEFLIESPQYEEIEGDTYKIYRSSNTLDEGLITITIS